MQNIFKTTFYGIMVLAVTCDQANQLANLSQITIFYEGWNINHYRSQSCIDLKLSGDSVVIDNDMDLKSLREIIAEDELIQAKVFHEIDARICCILYDNSQNVIKTYSFSPTSLMETDGRVYYTDTAFFIWILGYLPEDYLDS